MKRQLVTAYKMTNDIIQDKSKWPDFLINAFKKTPWQRSAAFTVMTNQALFINCKNESKIVYDGCWLVMDEKQNIEPISEKNFNQMFEPFDLEKNIYAYRT